MTQYLAARFASSQRGYTYRNDGEPVRCGDFVEVKTPSGAHAILQVLSITDEAPPFETKPIVAVAERPESWPADELNLEGKDQDGQ